MNLFLKKIAKLFGGILIGYLESFSPILLILGTVFVGAYIAPYVLTIGENLGEQKTKKTVS